MASSEAAPNGEATPNGEAAANADVTANGEVRATDTGAWTIGHGKEPVTGVMLGAVWVIEACCVVGGAMFWARSQLDGHAFCERCGCWTNGRKKRLLDATLSTTVLGRVREGDLTALHETQSAGANAKHYLQLVTGGCRNCGETNFLSLTDVKKTVDKKGKESTQSNVVVDKMLVSSVDLAMIEAAPAPPPPPPESPAPEAGSDDQPFDFSKLK